MATLNSLGQNDQNNRALNNQNISTKKTLNINRINTQDSLATTPQDTLEKAMINKPILVSKKISEKNKNLNYTISVRYPEITNQQNEITQDFNREAKELVIKEIEEFKNQEAPDPSIPAELGSNLEIDYKVLYLTEQFISIYSEVSNYSAGAAHLNNYSQVLNFNLTTGKKMELVDSFILNSNYLKVISDYCRKDLKKKKLEYESVIEGTKPVLENYRNWNIMQHGIQITFDPYQVASYAEGKQKSLVPYDALKNVIAIKIANHESTQELVQAASKFNNPTLNTVEWVAEEIVRQHNENANTIIDDMTVATSAKSEGKNVVFNYVQKIKKGLPATKLEEYKVGMFNEIAPKICKLNEKSVSFDMGLYYTLVYHNTYGEKLMEIVIDKATCERI